MRLPQATYELLTDMAHENPPPEEKWFTEDWFDPRVRRTDLNAAARTGRIEIDKTDAANWRFRFTSKGRADLEREEEERGNDLYEALTRLARVNADHP